VTIALLAGSLLAASADQVEHGCHSSLQAGTWSRAGRSDYTFCDGSARFRKYGAEVWPQNIWAVDEQERQLYAFPA